MSQFDAPIADGEDLTDFGDFQTSDAASESAGSSTKAVHNAASDAKAVDEDELADSNFADVFSGSLEDLVNTFDQKIISCFRDYDEDVEDIAPIQVLSEEELLNQSPYVQRSIIV